ncbi:MAG: 2,4-dihydroxyhept-2-ene-1,7-dioic acid aldolase, partial [Actinobacteria bacterium]|nr:2,4-dihydroxyhept-2-ene-1,7-dioic acid aldolase [Actinomycetota bacterium]
MRTLRQQWNDGDRAIGGWLSIPATFSAEVMSRVGFDYVCVDTQHGNIEYQMA